MAPSILIPGMWFYHEKNAFPWYIGHVNVDTAQLLRKVQVVGKPMTDSNYSHFALLQPIPLDKDILAESFGFNESIDPNRDGYYFMDLYGPINVLVGSEYVEAKPPTRLYIDISENSKRFTTFMECGANKIFISELSFVHELQLLIFSHTYKFPYLTIKKEKQNGTNNTDSQPDTTSATTED